MTGSEFVGRTHKFEDGATIHVVQSKRRDDGYWITYETNYGTGLAKRHVISESQFIDQFGHLFQNT